jgi:hypothetical protein
MNTGLPSTVPGMSARIRFRIGIHLPYLLRHRFRVVSQVDRVPVALAHLPVVEAGKSRCRRKQRLRLDENIAVELVESAHDLTRQLEVGHLIFADGTNLPS